MIKNGARLRSQVCDTEVIVVRATDGLADLRAGGVAMVPLDGAREPHGAPMAGFDGGALLGKRYVDESGAEVLVTKPGAGSLSVGTALLQVKAAKPLPASD
ncbi:hypothetical protein [Skermania piniformis]|uniref:10 kDa chaperonin n=1 Tax=Skermania pinensis TaxID=39122 RepID=A0ABX8SC69_9ACTN|nr:hypothetical protein [Skermania piniformis]QXQ15382.1 hypothetical protein KV203_08765 [Skermania piniformis]